MPLSCASLIIEVRALTGRTSDTELITTTRVMRWLNEAQKEVVQRCPELLHLTTKNNTSLDFSTNKSRYALGDFTCSVIDTTENSIAHIYDIWYQDGANSVKLNFVQTDEFDSEFPDITSSNFAQGKPYWWTRRAGNIETYPRCASAYDGKNVAINATWYGRDFTNVDTTRASDITNVDAGLIYYAVGEAWGAIGDEAKYQIWKTKFSSPNSIEGGFLEKFKDKNNLLFEWNGNLFGDNLV